VFRRPAPGAEAWESRRCRSAFAQLVFAQQQRADVSWRRGVADPERASPGLQTAFAGLQTAFAGRQAAFAGLQEAFAGLHRAFVS
jgi:hypothetical protein